MQYIEKKGREKMVSSMHHHRESFGAGHRMKLLTIIIENWGTVYVKKKTTHPNPTKQQVQKNRHK